MQPGDRDESADPRARRRERYIDRVFRVADHRKGRQQIPARAPVRGREAAPRRDCGGEKNEGRVRQRRRRIFLSLTLLSAALLAISAQAQTDPGIPHLRQQEALPRS